MNDKINLLNLQRYLLLFEAIAENASALGIYSNVGQQSILVTSNQLKQEALQRLNTTINWDSLEQHSKSLTIENLGHVFFSPLVLGANEQKYWLLGLLQTQPALTAEQINVKLNILNHIGSCLTEDYTALETITGMADELSVRYEELNLLYGMDDVESLYKNNDEQSSLQQISQNCVDYLNIDYAAIYIHDQTFFTHLLSDENLQSDNDFFEKIITNKLYEYIQQNPQTLVINRDIDIDWTDANLKIPYKLIAAPIFRSNQSLCGLLVLINSLDNLDFSNSDRKLTEVLAAEASKLTQARRDPITSQLNRRGFTEKLEKIFNNPTLSSENSCLLILDIDQFKVINDSVGQVGGDLLLKQISTVILKNLKNSDIFGRLGSDEFAIILDRCSLEQANDRADRILTVIKQFRFLYQDKLFDLSACIGIVELNQEIESFSQALSNADLACSVAKEQGRNRSHVYQAMDEMTQKHENQMLWVSRINLALEENHFKIFRQKIELLQGDPAQEEHYEILLRLEDENGDILSPFHFIPAAEHYNLMPKIDRWVVTNTLKKMAAVFDKNPDSKLVCSINLSGQSFCEEGFNVFLKEQIRTSGVPANTVCLEMTETAAVSNLTQAVEFMDELKAIGCHFSLDDFGSGMSSFTYLKNLPVDYLKIDGYFVKTMLKNKIDLAMVKSIHDIGNVMGLKTIAEFVENDTIMDELTKMGVNYGQGYGIGKPQPFI